MKISSKLRQLTVGYKWYSRGRYSVTYVKSPFIKISGNWLKDNGFDTGQKIKVHCEDRKLVITVAQEPE